METPLKSRILTLDRVTPRYTSYPPATAFQPEFSADTYRQWLLNLAPDSPVSLYVHIPFCQKLCYYCGCHTSVPNRPGRIDDYAGDVMHEINLLARSLTHRVTLSHLHFGGGSPSILPPVLFSSLMEHIRRHFDIQAGAEIAIEADPRQISEAKIASFARQGVSRISLGVQDFDQTVLKAVNRIQPFHLSYEAVNLCRAYGIRQINIDMMYGLPGQSVSSILRGMETAIALNPGRIAFFGYAHVPWIKKHMTMMEGQALPDASLRYDLYEAGSQLLKDAGYLPVGIDHFVRPRDPMAKALGNRTLRRNFQGYTIDDAATLLGIGASSIGYTQEGYIQNIADLRLYRERLSQGLLPVNRGYRLTGDDRLYADLISEIMCYLAVDLSILAQRHGKPLSYFSEGIHALSPLIEANLLTMNDHFIRIAHPHVARMAAACFDPMLREAALAGRHSRAV